MRLPGERLFRRALDVPRIQEILGDMPENHKLYHICICYNCIAKGLMDMERMKLRESQPLDALIAAVEMVAEGDFQLVEDEEGNITAIPQKSLMEKKL